MEVFNVKVGGLNGVSVKADSIQTVYHNGNVTTYDILSRSRTHNVSVDMGDPEFVTLKIPKSLFPGSIVINRMTRDEMIDVLCADMKRMKEATFRKNSVAREKSTAKPLARPPSTTKPLARSSSSTKYYEDEGYDRKRFSRFNEMADLPSAVPTQVEADDDTEEEPLMEVGYGPQGNEPRLAVDDDIIEIVPPTPPQSRKPSVEFAPQRKISVNLLDETQ